jgi:hypothetical protein
MNKKSILHVITILAFILFIIIGLASTGSTPAARSETSTGPRTIILNDKKYTEEDVGGFNYWLCYDYINEKKLILEIGTFGDPELSGLGYILYDGGYIGELTYYRRNGLEHRWDWGGINDSSYSFVIKSDGTGLYYDFTNVKLGESTKARDVFKCKKK